jgi:Transposase
MGMEATGGGQYWARQFTALGHEVRLMSPALVMPYRKGNKTDRNDADAILEAVSRPSMRFVMVKSVAQQDLLALHKVRAQLVKSRTALCNQLRGLLRERGVAVRMGVAALKRSLPAALADESSELSGEMRELLSEMSQWLRTLEQRIASCEARITRKFKHDGALHKILIALTVQFEEVPRTSPDKRVDVEHIFEGFWYVTAHYGFMEIPNLPAVLWEAKRMDCPVEPDKAVYFGSRDRVVPGQSSSRISRCRLRLFAFMFRNSVGASDLFSIPTKQYLEIGRQIEV